MSSAFETLAADLRYAALGIGANTAVFSLIDALLLRMLPVAHPEELVFVNTNAVQMGHSGFSTHLERGAQAQAHAEFERSVAGCEAVLYVRDEPVVRHHHHGPAGGSDAGAGAIARDSFQFLRSVGAGPFGHRSSHGMGARRDNILRMILGETAVLPAAGVAAGLAIALSTARWIQSMLFGVTPTDALSLSGASAMLIIAAPAAGFLPARRASRLDPMVALRDQ
jgi:hypothetical protein